MGDKLIAKKQETPRKIPKGAEILSKEITMEVEEITNGYIICKRTETRYKEKGKEYNDYTYDNVKTYSKDNPFLETQEKELADFFD